MSGASGERLSADRRVAAAARAVFDVLADPTTHAAIDGTGWVTAAVDAEPLASVGQRFRMAMFHPDHPDGSYETVNEVIALERDRVLAWRTGYVEVSGELVFEGWWWRYDLVPTGSSSTEVTHTYDWSAVGPGPRAELSFPPFGVDHLDGSLRHLAAVVEGREGRP